MNVSDLVFSKEKTMVRDFLDESMGLRPQGNIQIIRDYPVGWHAFAPADNKVMMIGCTRDGYMRLVDVLLCRGFYSNGNIRLGFFDEDDNFRKLMDFYESEKYREDYYRSPLNCGGSACNSSSANCIMCNNARREI